jgi:hypothetical protein
LIEQFKDMPRPVFNAVYSDEKTLKGYLLTKETVAIRPLVEKTRN